MDEQQSPSAAHTQVWQPGSSHPVPLWVAQQVLASAAQPQSASQAVP